ncbi:hypothetical protein [Thermoactinomyces mirandus]|uniref:Uncharacterized protein n=1 Tax=Thermoactinomyces mirandus TaxID=2756294 RepID=A0A7W2AQB5_9BACL|nr:hypothetical protein [Thermoactinomyces mirandus]MBA4601343.1 hypothetical protein [Thermoactinomyces mirandus]
MMGKGKASLFLAFAFAFSLVFGTVPVTGAKTVVQVNHADLGKVPYQIVDTNGDIHSYKTKADYLAAEKKFREKWSRETDGIRAQASDYATESFEHAYFGGWKYTTPVGYYTNFNNSHYNDGVSSLKTARKSSGTQVCYHRDGGEPCKTFGPGLDIVNVGDGWNDQISYIRVYR